MTIEKEHGSSCDECHNKDVRLVVVVDVAHRRNIRLCLACADVLQRRIGRTIRRSAPGAQPHTMA